jgi:lysozyme family protein
MQKSIDIIIDDIIRAEGDYSDNPNDSGGKTRWGITEAVARSNGYAGSMTELPKDFARSIYYKLYVVKPQFDKVLLLSVLIASELVDTGVNMGTATACIMLQKTLNAFNNCGKLYPDLVPDGDCGQKTINALSAYLNARKNDDGERVLLVALNCLQGARYIDIAAANAKQETFAFGWMKNRVSSQV